MQYTAKHPKVAAYNKAIGEKVKYLRKEKGIRQCQLAQLMGLTRINVCNLERGRQNISAFQAALLSSVFKVELKDILPQSPVLFDFEIIQEEKEITIWRPVKEKVITTKTIIKAQE